MGSHGTIKEEMLLEVNAFQAMFMVPRSHWLADQAARSSRMIAVATCLEALGHELSAFRQHQQ